MALNLPPVPPELKSISPYLQRSEELAAQDPVVSYWCGYYAAQLGISVKPKDSASRTFLFTLLGALEVLKKEIGPNDAIEDESAASAYIENFGLKVFAIADNEDRRGAATRGTAKKFLAAANFLEVLRTFDKPDPASDNPNEEKIRYAKWKAADIAKAFREGRKPTPGPAGSETVITPPALASPDIIPPVVSPPGVPSSPQATSTASVIYSPPSTSTPQQEGFFDAAPATRSQTLLPHTHPHRAPELQTPNTWSTVATPGTPGQAAGADGLTYSSVPAAPRRAYVSEELEGREEEDVVVIAPADGQVSPGDVGREPDKRVYFSPSVVGGLSTSSVTSAIPTTSTIVPSDSLPPPAAPALGFPPGFVSTEVIPAPSAPLMEPPPGFVSLEAHTPPTPGGFEPDFVVPVPPPINNTPVPPPAPTIPTYTSMRPPPVPLAQEAPVLSPSPQPVVAAPATTTQVAVELTPMVLSRAQKHCRFAISSLDYEDVEQARKELRNALKLLGG